MPIMEHMEETSFFPEAKKTGKRADVLPSRKAEPATPAKKPRKPTKGKALDCESCGGITQAPCRSPQMDYHGQGGRGILWLAESPGPDEDDRDDQLVGKAGQLLRGGLNRVGLDLEEDGHRLNGANCYMGRKDNGDFLPPTNHQLACCRQVKVAPAIQTLKPKFIVLFGNAALQSFWGEDHNNLTAMKFRGRVFPDEKTGAWVFPMLHPSYVLRNRGNPNLQALWKRDLKRLSRRIKTWPDPVIPDPTQQVEIIQGDSPGDFQHLVDTLERILDGAYRIVFDYETSGLNPARPGHKIYSISVVPYFPGQKEEDRISYSFPLQYPGAWYEDELNIITGLWVAILMKSKIRKAAHNIQYEDLWTRVILGELVGGWEWCTMNNQHIIDNTQGITSLKWQAWERWGIWGYDKEFKKYTTGVPTKEEKAAGIKASTHSFNKVHEMPLPNLLLYGGIDGILESWLLDEQLEEIPEGSGLDNARALFHDGILTAADQREEGIPVDSEYYDKKEVELLDKADQLKADLLDSPEAQLFKEKEGHEIKLTSNPDLRKLLFTHLGHAPFKLTDSGAESVDAETMDNLDIPFANTLVEMRKLNRIVHTYFDQIRREAHAGKIHTITNFHIPRTYRPCLAKGTMIEVVRNISTHPEGIPIEDVKVGDYVYCYDDDLKPTIRKVVWSGKTGENANVVRLHWRGGKGGRGHLDLTPEHLVRHISGKYVEAHQTTEDHRVKGESKHAPKFRVLSMSRSTDRLFFTGNFQGVREGRFVYENIHGPLEKGEIVHHRDGNHYNHCPENLQVMLRREHSSFHSLQNSGVLSERMKKGWREGQYDNAKNFVKSGFENANSLRISRFRFLRLISRARGKPTKVPHDFGTVKSYADLYGVELNSLFWRYGNNNIYVGKGKLLKLLNVGGFDFARRELKRDYYSLKKLMGCFGILGNGCGGYYVIQPVNNHSIIRVEELETTVDVYDIRVEDFSNFIANGICVHNSLTNPNMANVPKRDKMAKEAVRRGIRVPPGYCYMANDYGGIEVHGLEWYSLDAKLLKYLNNPDSDMHRDQTMGLFQMENVWPTRGGERLSLEFCSCTTDSG